jgi:hypothetical protein
VRTGILPPFRCLGGPRRAANHSFVGARLADAPAVPPAP